MTDSNPPVNDESNSTENVLPINTQLGVNKRVKKKKTDGGDGGDKPKKGTIFETLYRVFFRLSNAPAYFTDPKIRLGAWKVAEGLKQVIRIDQETEVCSAIKKESLAEEILRYVRQELSHLDDYNFTAASARDCADYMIMAMEYMDKPAHVRFNSDPGLCFNRLPFDLAPGPTPHFDELFSRMGNAPAVKAWIASVFIPESYNQQYVWIRGEGSDGKSSIMEFLAKIFGDEGSLAQNEAPGKDTHWAEAWVGKRFVYFPDFEDVFSLKKGPLKAITGGDRIPIRPMYKAGSYSVKLPVKLLFSSNPEPVFDFSKSDKRRLIYAEIEAGEHKVNPRYHDLLWAEGGAFLYECFRVYRELCPEHGEIPLDPDSFAVLEDNRNRSDREDYQLWFDFYFAKVSDGQCTATEVADAIQQRFQERASRMGAYNWLKRNGYKLKQYRGEDGERSRLYKGIKRKIIDLADPNRTPW